MASVLSLDVSNLTGVRGQRVLFRGLSFRVAAGRALSLEGPNGAGKTSLLRMIAGFLTPAAGAIALGAATEADERGRLVGWLGHHDGAKPQLTPREVLAFFAQLYRVEADVAGALAAVGLASLADLPCQYLSAGQKKRLALARLKMSGRAVWLLDEPLAALDADGKARCAELIRSHCLYGGIAIAATHEPLGIDGERLVLS
ncbi:MAG TPA: heme ABC exporter ATP-binding protein CcmA [Rhizomicrobium sp.]|jgi:heme exporter protein A|nr:heme ABC exporter ATP-binding protein CcmA [Rhizomicrobium sp.]